MLKWSRFCFSCSLLSFWRNTFWHFITTVTNQNNLWINFHTICSTLRRIIFNQLFFSVYFRTRSRNSLKRSLNSITTLSFWTLSRTLLVSSVFSVTFNLVQVFSRKFNSVTSFIKFLFFNNWIFLRLRSLSEAHFIFWWNLRYIQINLIMLLIHVFLFICHAVTLSVGIPQTWL